MVVEKSKIGEMSSVKEPVDSGKRVKRAKPNVAAKEELTGRKRGASYYDTLLWRLRSRMDAESTGCFVIGVTSFARRSGVTTVAANLAIRAADHHLSPVLLIDANLQFARQHRAFRLRGKLGLADVLTGGCAPAEGVYKTRVESLDIMPLGSKDHLDRARIAPEQFEELMKWARESYSTIIIDLPEAEDLRHSLMLARRADTALIVVRAETVTREDAQKAMIKMNEDGIHVGGLILNRKKRFAPKWLTG